MVAIAGALRIKQSNASDGDNPRKLDAFRLESLATREPDPTTAAAPADTSRGRITAALGVAPTRELVDAIGRSQEQLGADELPPQRGDVVVEPPQHTVQLAFTVRLVGIEAVCEVLEDDGPLGA